MNHIEAMKHALKALEEVQEFMNTSDWFNEKVTSLRQAIADHEKCENFGEFGICCQQQQIPLMQEGKDFTISKPWVGPTDKDIHECFMLTEFDHHVDFNRDPEQWCLAFAKELSNTLKQKNGYAEEKNNA